MVKAILKNYRQSARKVRLVADSVRGKNAEKAVATLAFVPKKTALPIQKLIQSAIANAKHNFGMDSAELFIKTITVDEGYTLKRWRPRARGSAFPIRKRTSIVTVVLDTKTPKASSDSDADKKAEVKKVTKAKTVKKAVTKKSVTKKKVSPKKTVNKK